MPQGLKAVGLVAGSAARDGSGVKGQEEEEEEEGTTERMPTVSGTRAAYWFFCRVIYGELKTCFVVSYS